MSTRTVAVSTKVPIPILWDAGKYSMSKDVSIGLEFTQENGAFWNFTNRDVDGVTWLDGTTIRVQMSRGVCIDLDIRTRKGFLHETRG